MEDAVNVTAPSAKSSSLAERHAADLLELFYPVHYRSNMAVEEAMRAGLSRKQAAILWLIRSAGSDSQNAQVADSLRFGSAQGFGRSRVASAQRLRCALPRAGRSMRRKEIVLRLQDWFDVSSPAITKALRGMARPPIGLVRLVEDAASAREKRVILTPKGDEFIRTMVERGRAFLQPLMEQLPEERVSAGIDFLRAAVAVVERVHSHSRRR
jgi:DNA-binding MarR family transcriptional regulator